jgi:hypothetical protein
MSLRKQPYFHCNTGSRMLSVSSRRKCNPIRVGMQHAALSLVSVYVQQWLSHTVVRETGVENITMIWICRLLLLLLLLLRSLSRKREIIRSIRGLLHFHIQTLHLDIIKVFFIHQLMHKWIVLKTISKFTLKQLRHVSVQLHHHQGAHYSSLLKLLLLK